MDAGPPHSLVAGVEWMDESKLAKERSPDAAGSVSLVPVGESWLLSLVTTSSAGACTLAAAGGRVPARKAASGEYVSAAA
jgi:hypothetical protein